jgi:hypothetical protein
MKDLFGNELPPAPKSRSNKIHVATKKNVVEKKEIDTSKMGLNAIYKDFGNYIVKNRGNKTL